MKRRLVTVAVVASVFGAAPAAAPVISGPILAPSVAIAKTCSSGYKHAVVSGAHKCLRRGQFCACAKDRTYHRYGFHCHKRDTGGRYHLT